MMLLFTTIPASAITTHTNHDDAERLAIDQQAEQYTGRRQHNGRQHQQGLDKYC